MARRSRRERITAAFDRLYDAVAGALGGVAALRDRAAKSHAETMVEMWLRDAGLDGARADAELVGVIANPRLADVVARVQADRDAAFGSWLRTGPAALIDLMGTAAPGAAGAVENWLGASTGARTPGPRGSGTTARCRSSGESVRAASVATTPRSRSVCRWSTSRTCRS